MKNAIESLSKLINVKVQVNILMCYDSHPVVIDGLVVYYDVISEVQTPSVIIEGFNYYAQNHVNTIHSVQSNV